MSLTLRESLKKHLEAKRYNLSSLANDAGVPAPTLSRILSGQRNPKYETAKKLAESANKLTGLEDFYSWQDFKEQKK